MPQRIIYPNDDGSLAVVIPSPEAVAIWGITAIARKDVPAGKPFRIVDTADLPADRSLRDAWAADFTAPDGVGADGNEFPPQEPAP